MRKVCDYDVGVPVYFMHRPAVFLYSNMAAFSDSWLPAAISIKEALFGKQSIGFTQHIFISSYGPIRIP